MSTNSELDNKKSQIQRDRVNLLRSLEQPTLLFLCRILPKQISPDMLTFIGFLGTLMIFAAFYFAKIWSNNIYLLLAIFGFALNWFGDSLDGRIAYFRNIPRKWYGFALDCIMDLISLIFMGLGFFIYIQDEYKIFVFLFCSQYAWAILLAQLKYKITDKYSIDPGPLGPTETRMILCLVILSEYIFGNVLIYFSMVVNVLLLIINLVDTYKTLQFGDERDKLEKSQKLNANQ